jgi:hypothetical protein
VYLLVNVWQAAVISRSLICVSSEAAPSHGVFFAALFKIAGFGKGLGIWDGRGIHNLLSGFCLEARKYALFLF